MARDFSPEERLLNLIRGKKKAAHSADENAVARKEEEPKEGQFINKPLPEPGLQNINMPIDKQVKPKADPRKRFELLSNAQYIYIIAGVLLIGVVFIVLTIFSSSENQELKNLTALVESVDIEQEPDSGKPNPAAPGADNKLPATKTENKTESSFEDYQKLLNEKNIFAPAANKSTAGFFEGPSLREAVKDLRLVGVIPGDQPQVIIEDKKSQQTLFLRVGESIEGIDIKEISNGKVVLGRGEETVTLSL